MKQSPKDISLILTISGFAILLFALVFYAFGHVFHFNSGGGTFLINKNLFVIATCVIGVFLIVAGSCGLFIKKSKQAQIEEKDERNQSIANMAKASSYEVMTCLFSVSIAILSLSGAINSAAFFTLFTVFICSQAVFIIRLWYLQKTM